MTDSSKPPARPFDHLPRFERLGQLVERIGQRTHAGFAMLVAAALDRVLEQALTAKMVTLNSDMRAKIFGDFGTLGTFSAKIDVAYAMGIADRDTYQRLTAVRKVRNLFAHSNEQLNFASEAIRDLIGGQPGDTSIAATERFVSVATEVEASVAAASRIPHRGVVKRLYDES